MYTVQIILPHAGIEEWLRFWKELLTWLIVCCVCICSVIFQFGFEDIIVALIVPAPSHCLILP